jgi:hypothetical protein
MTRPAGRLLLALLLGTGWLVAPPSAAAASVTFGQPSASATFGQGVDFRQPVSIAGAVRRIELLIQYPGAPGPEVRIVPVSPGSTALRFSLEASKGGLLPNTQLSARWRVVGDDGSVSLGPAASVRYEDTRFAWQTRTAGIVRVHWYEGNAAFGDRAMQVGVRAIEAASRLLGVIETQPLDFYIYAGQRAFYDALGPGTRENVGGQANAEIRTLFALITPGEISASWVQTVITHELTHLVFDTAVHNPYHFPPRWLNEGLAVYLSQGYASGDRASVERSAADGSLMPLGALAFQFPTTRDRFALAYAESVAAVDYLVRTHGEAALVSLVRAYAGGVTDDEAFRTALGTDVAGFDASWRASVRAREPVAYGPQPAPAGPLPESWTGAAVASPAGSTATVPSPAGASAVPALPDGQRDGGAETGLQAMLAAGGVLALTFIVLVILVRRSSPGRPAVAQPAQSLPADARPSPASATDGPSDATPTDATPTDDRA